jgi:hypothetical protein
MEQERQMAGNWAEKATLPKGRLEKALLFSGFEPETFEEKETFAKKLNAYSKYASSYKLYHKLD